MKTALLLIDIQNDYFEGGKYELYKSNEAVEKASNVLSYFRNENLLLNPALFSSLFPHSFLMEIT